MMSFKQKLPFGRNNGDIYSLDGTKQMLNSRITESKVNK